MKSHYYRNEKGDKAIIYKSGKTFKIIVLRPDYAVEYACDTLPTAERLLKCDGAYNWQELPVRAVS